MSSGLVEGVDRRRDAPSAARRGGVPVDREARRAGGCRRPRRSRGGHVASRSATPLTPPPQAGGGGGGVVVTTESGHDGSRPRGQLPANPTSGRWRWAVPREGGSVHHRRRWTRGPSSQILESLDACVPSERGRPQLPIVRRSLGVPRNTREARWGGKSALGTFTSVPSPGRESRYRVATPTVAASEPRSLAPRLRTRSNRVLLDSEVISLLRYALDPESTIPAWACKQKHPMNSGGRVVGGSDRDSASRRAALEPGERERVQAWEREVEDRVLGVEAQEEPWPSARRRCSCCQDSATIELARGLPCGACK